jgi:hypothetical protein
MTVKPKITAADPGVELRWVSSLPGIISGEHRFTLTPADGGTRLEQSETFHGLLAAFPGKTFTRAEASFRGLNEALGSGRRTGPNPSNTNLLQRKSPLLVTGSAVE